MKPEFICFKDFENLKPENVFRKEHSPNLTFVHPAELENKHILFRKKFFTDKFKKAIISLSADDHFKLYVNGRFITEGPAPSYPCAYNYMDIDLTPYLKYGENTLAFHTYYQGLSNRVWVSADLREMLWFKLDIDGKTVCVSDENCKCALHSAYSEIGKFGYDTAFAECFDSSSPDINFANPDFDDSSWENAKIYKNADYKLVKQSTPSLVYSELCPVISEKRGNTYFFDFGNETVCTLTAKAKGKKGDKIILKYGEELNPDGTVRYQMRCNCNYVEKWILSGNNDILEQYDYKAFRYAEIDVPDGVCISDIKMLVRHFPFELKAKYPKDNENLNKIINLCADTIKYGTQEGFVDCPSREKGQYLGDVSIAARAQAVLTNDTTMMKKAITDFCNSSFICKGIMAVSNSSLMQEIADYSLQFPAQIAWVYAMDGDKEFVKYTEPYVTGAFEHFKKFMNPDGLLDCVSDKWNLVDWPDNLRDNYDFKLTKPIGKGLHNVINAFWYGFLVSVDEIYEILGKEKTGLTEKVGKSFEKTFYNEKTGLYTDSPVSEHSAIHSNVLPLLFGLCSGNKEKTDRICEFISKKGLGSMGVYMAYFTLAALKRAERDDLALKLTLSEDAWLNMLSEGATTTFEAWGKDQKKNCSLFHPWATAPAIIFAENIRVY